MSGEPTEHTLDLRKVEDRYARGERKGAGSAGGAETISVPPDWRSKERDGLWRTASRAQFQPQFQRSGFLILLHCSPSRTDGEFEKGLKLGKLLIRANARLKLFKRGECGRKNNKVEMQLGHTFLGRTAKAAPYLLSDSISYYSQVLVLEVPDVRGDACVRRRMGKWGTSSLNIFFQLSLSLSASEEAV